MDKLNYKNMVMKQKLLNILIISSFISIIIGIFYLLFISKSNKNLVLNTLNNFFNTIKTNKLNYQSGLFNSFSSNTLTIISIWLIGISIVGIPIVIIILLFKAFILGFSISSLIYFYNFKGIILALIYIIPQVINLVTIIILSFFSITFSKNLFKMFFLKRTINFKLLTNKYLKILGLSLVVMLLSTIIEVFIVPYVFKIF